MMSICLMMFGVYAASNPSVSISGQVSYSVHDAKVMVQGKINGTKEYPTDVDYKKPTNINNLTDSDKLTDSQNQFLNFTTGASLTDDANDNLGTWNFGNLNFYEDQNGIKTIKISLLVTNLSNYPVKATLTYSNSYDNVTVTANKLESYLAKYDQSKNADANQSLLTNDEFVVELKVTDDSKNANASNFSMNIKVEKYSDPDATLDKLTLTYNGTLYDNFGSYGDAVIGATSPQGLEKYYLAEIKQGATGEIVIPAMYNDGEHGDLPVVPGRVNGLVTAIQALGSGKNADEVMVMVAIPQVTNVILNTGITEVQNLAFAVMPSLASIQLPSSLMYHQGGTFGASGALTTVSLPYGTEDLKTCPVGTTEIGMFVNCEGLESFWMPDTVQTAGDYAFSSCSNLKQVHLSENLQAISNSMFYANNLISIEITNSVTYVGNYAFSACSNLTSIAIPENVTRIGTYAFSKCISLAAVTIPKGVTNIADYTFYGCSGLTSLTISDGVVSIGFNAFRDCTGLTSIKISESVTSIGAVAFFGCSSLTFVTIPESVASLGNYAFSECTNLTSVTINAVSPPSITRTLFENCTKLNAIYVPSQSVSDYKTATNWEYYASKIVAIG